MRLDRSLLRHRRTKIVATLGPARSAERRIRELLQAGVSVFRLYFSHGAPDDHRKVARRVRRAARALGLHVPILGDLSGPKIRTGRFESGAIELVPGAEVVVTGRKVVGRPGLIPSAYRRLALDVKPGDPLLLDDGNLELVVLAVDAAAGDIRCRVERGGQLKDNKGINVPSSPLNTPALTAKDRADATAAAEMELDYLALSFVRTAADVKKLRSHLRKLGSSIPIVAKIEKPQAIEDIDAILDATDAVMVARGDLGVELPPERVPVMQSELTRLSRIKNRPVIVATQMLESMVERARPTRAEVNDVAAAAFAGADAVMLSAETATGKHPVTAVATMDKILREVESHLWTEAAFARFDVALRSDSRWRVQDAIGTATAQLSRDLQVRAILVPSRTGTSVRAVSCDRPAAPIVALAEVAVCRRVALLWGVVPREVAAGAGEPTEEICRRLARELGAARRGDHALVVRGFDPDPERATPTITVLTV